MSGSAGDWQPLDAELQAWTAAGRRATFWWRDDDAIEPTPALDRMIDLSQHFSVPLGLAVIPAKATPALAGRLQPALTVDVLQHGFSHQNHAGSGERAAEFGPQRPLDVRLTEQQRGWHMLDGFPRRVPIFVPPWNRYDRELAKGFSSHGLKAISAFGDGNRLPFPIVECNCHIDIISWRTTRGFAGVAKTIVKLVDHLHARRSSTDGVDAVTGLLTHHLVHDEGCWSFLTDLFSHLERHACVQWVRPMNAVRTPPGI
jgi:hypothetical protein